MVKFGFIRKKMGCAPVLFLYNWEKFLVYKCFLYMHLNTVPRLTVTAEVSEIEPFAIVVFLLAVSAIHFANSLQVVTSLDCPCPSISKFEVSADRLLFFQCFF